MKKRWSLGSVGFYKRGLLTVAPFFLCVSGVIEATGQSRAYVANSSSYQLTAIDTTTETIAATIPLGFSPLYLAISRNGSRIYVTHPAFNAISVIDAISNTLIATIPTPSSPAYPAITPNGELLYVTASNGVLVVNTASNTVMGTIATGTSNGGIAITPDGSRAYLGAGVVKVLDLSTNTVIASLETISASGPVAISPDGAKAYFSTNGANLFGAEGGIHVVNTATNTLVRTVIMGVLPGQIALSPDGGRAYVGVQSRWVDTGYGAAFIPGNSVTVIETASGAIVGSIGLGSGGVAWNLQNTASGIVVAPDRSDVYVSIPRINVVAVAGVSTNRVRQQISVAPSPLGLAAKPDGATIVPYVINAVPDTAPALVPSTGGIAVSNVLANDKLGGIGASLFNVTLSQRSSTTAGVTLNAAVGSVHVAAGTPIGQHSLVYKICEIGFPAHCDQATVKLTVRAPYAIDAVNDAATTTHGKTAIASVLANDTLGGAAATLATVNLATVSSSNSGVTLDAATGSVSVAIAVAPGTHQLTYRICEIASPENCDQAVVAVTVIPIVVDAVNDNGTAPRTGGTAVVNVLANDKFDGAAADLSKVTLASVSSSNPGITLNTTTRAVTAASGIPSGVHSLVYKICEIASPANCDTATVSVTVSSYVVNAVNDYAKVSSKTAGIAIASVLTNDRLGNAAATTANVTLALVSLTPPNSQIRLDLTDGSVDILGKTSSDTYALVYKICEQENPTNCDQATVTLELSGGL